MSKEKIFRILKQVALGLWNMAPDIKESNCYCVKCGAVDRTRNNAYPVSGCPNNAPWQEHDWRDIGPVGNTPYVCTYCGARVNSDGEPKNCECIRNKAGHNWVRG